MRIRKRSAAASSGKPEPHERSNGALHIIHATSESNPSSHPLTSSLVSHPGIIKQDHNLLLAGSASHGTLHRSSQKLGPAEAVFLKRKPGTSYVSAGAESYHDKKAGVTQQEDEIPACAKRVVMDVQHIEAKHMHVHDGDDIVKGLHMRGCEEEVGLLAGIRDLAMVDATDCPRKVRPLQLILSYNPSSTATKLPPPLCPTSSSNSMPCTPPPMPRKSDKTSPSALVITPPLILSPGGSSIKQIGEVKSRDHIGLVRNEDAASSCSSEESLANAVGNRAELESRQLLSTSKVSTWQGHRRPRSNVQGGRGRPAVASVNAVSRKESAQKRDSTEQITRKKPKQTKRKPLDTLVSLQQLAPQPATSPSPASAGHGSAELRKQGCLAPKSNNLSKTTQHDPLFLSISSAATDAPTKIIRSILATGLLDSKSAAATATPACDEQVASILPAAAAAASEQDLQHDFMRCRRKDGRRWRCKAQVVKAGAPFCHYHTLKMREKHAASVARKLSMQQLQLGEGKVGVSQAGFPRRAKKRIRVKSPPSMKAVHETVDHVEDETGEPGGDEEEEEEEEEENETQDEKEQKTQVENAEKQHEPMQESITSKRRWRKKCKPCIRRLHDIHDRARPAGTDGLDLFKFCEDTSSLANKDSLPRPSCWPLPECLLNTDPREWRSDFL